MPVRRIAYIIAIFAAVLTAFNLFRTPADYSEAIATCRNNKNKPDEIIQACSELIDIAGISDSNLHLFLLKRGSAYNRKEEYDQALRDYQWILGIDPKNNRARDRIVTIYIKRGEIDLATEVMNQTIVLSPDNPGTHRILGMFHLKYSGDYEQSLKALLRSDELGPDNYSTLMLLSAVYLRLGDAKHSEPYIEKLTIMSEQYAINEMNPLMRILYKFNARFLWNGSQKHVYNGFIYSTIGYPDIALSEYKQFLEKGGGFAVRRLRYAMRRKGFCPGSCLIESEGGEFYEELGKFIASSSNSIFYND